MPKKKKLKQRVRARMAKTGERYTEARFKEFDEREDLVEHTHRRIRLAWPRLDVWQVMLAVGEFYEGVEHEAPSSWAVVATHVLELLTFAPNWPEAIRAFLESYKKKPEVPSGMAVVPWSRSPQSRSPQFQEHFEWIRDFHGVPSRVETPTPEWAAIPDEEFFRDSEESLDRLRRVTREVAREVDDPLVYAEQENERLRDLLREHGIDPNLMKKRARRR